MTTPLRVLLLTTAHSYRNEAFQRAADRLGVEVVRGVSMQPELAQRWHGGLGLDLEHPDAAAATIAAYSAEQPLAAILAVDDSGVIAAAAAAARLGLPHNDPAAAEAARDKRLMRSLMAAAGVPCPWFQTFSSGDDPAQVAQQVPYPCVVKPTRLNGSRGVIRANNPAEFIAAARRLARLLRFEYGDEPQPYLVESFIPGFEVALEGMLDGDRLNGDRLNGDRLNGDRLNGDRLNGDRLNGGELTVLALFDKPDPLDGPFFEETLYVTPSRLPHDVQAAIADCAARAARAIGLHTGPIHAELRVNDQGPWLLEVAGRSIGGLCGQTLRFDEGRTLEEVILRQACGLPWHGSTATGRASGVMMIPIPEAGVLRGITGIDAARSVPGIEDVEISVPLHHSVTPLPEGDSYLGFLFARADTPDAVEAALRTAHACLHFHIVPEFAL